MKALWIVKVLIGYMVTTVSAQLVDLGGIYEIKTADKIKVYVMPGFDMDGAHTYYYLPANLRLSSRPDLTPEFSFMTYNTGSQEELAGAILHFLLVWGLTPNQQKDVEMILRSSLDSLAIVAGAVSLEAPLNSKSFTFEGNTELAHILQTQWSEEPVAPVLPGTKIAVSYKLDKEEARLFKESLESPSAFDKIQVALNFQIRGGHKDVWFNRFHENYYVLKVCMRQLLTPVLTNNKTTKK
jgi:hypothetical protein